ncbi:hypothetical protein GCM10027440_17200 [Nocardiopsis coralliicola]
MRTNPLIRASYVCAVHLSARRSGWRAEWSGPSAPVRGVHSGAARPECRPFPAGERSVSGLLTQSESATLQ